ncbi:DUF373 family protein [Salinarchaeum sp. Harcht-Bsk1]|uniref:DUF373 family protein n=1 Tax=Salinarchaeum sp. Harcht-Bsk1 TaxID=1333523 RepID=UPI0009DBDC53|nr:DUF373 family protein [Salinarchaeum sp. Harcht-Bsk1]
MTTLVVCLDRTDDVGATTGIQTPVAGWEAVQALVTDVGLADPEDASVNSILEALRITRELRDDGENAVVAVVSGTPDSMVTADRTVAGQLDDLVAEYDPDSAIVVTDSAEDERLVPIVESRVPVDSVDRVVVRQARDLESTYYLMKQFLADEELRQTTLVPLGTALLVFPALAVFAGPAVAAATIATVIGLFLLYKGLGVDELLARAARQAQNALYSGQVSVVTYVVAAGLTLVGVFAGALGISAQPETEGVLLPVMRFAYDAVPWLAMAALTASTGRLLDEVLRDDGIRTSYLNLPFVALAVALVVRGFSAYFLEEAGTLGPLEIPRLELGVLTVEPFVLEAGQRLALYVVSGVVVSLIGVRIAAYLGGGDFPGVDLEAAPDGGDGTADRDGDAESETG